MVYILRCGVIITKKYRRTYWSLVNLKNHNIEYFLFERNPVPNCGTYRGWDVDDDD